MRTTTSLLLPCALALAAASGCGDDDPPAVDAGGDAGPPAVSCPSVAPDRAAMTGPCCYRVSNADRLDAAELRLAAFQLTEPPTLDTLVVSSVLSNALDSELFNWLLKLEVTGTDVSVTTGYGVRSCVPMGPESCAGDSTYAFDVGGTYPPVTFAGSLAGETLSAPRLDGSFTVPVFAEDGMTVQLLLPLNNLEISRIDLSEMRSCIGIRRGPGWVPAGELSAFITVESARSAMLVVGTTVNTTLCMLIAGNSTSMMLTCDDIPQSDWMQRPDSLCAGTPAVCTQDPGDGSVCDPSTTCNAWLVRGEVSGQGVEITN